MLLLLSGVSVTLAGDEQAAKKAEVKLPAVFSKRDPASIDDLRAIEKHVQSLTPKLSAATVGVRIGRAQGSGVVVSEDGYVLTAAHVIGAPGRDVTLIFPDGKRVKATTLGVHKDYDAGLIKITDEGKWPFVAMHQSNEIKIGDWCIAMGHPGGFQSDRAPVLRLGRVIRKQKNVIQTDAILVGGDSGGPLFNMLGQVIGINSRIGPNTSWNFHAPIWAYTEHWDDLKNSEVLGGPKAILGVNGETVPQGTRVTEVAEGYPAEEAGLKVGDIIVKFAGAKAANIDELAKLVMKKRPGQTVDIEILRDDKTVTLKAKLAAR